MRPGSGFPERFWRALPWVLALAAPIITLTAILLLSVDVPYWDQWEMTPLIQKSIEGRLAFSDLWAWHNEHRPLVPRLLLLGLARMTHWNVRCELLASFALAALLFGLLAAFVIRRARATGGGNSAWTICLLSWVVFSLSQWENWFLGWQFQVFLCSLCAVGAMLLLGRRKLGIMHTCAAALLAAVATCSFGSGAALWPVGFLVLAARWKSECRYGPPAVWTVSACVLLAAYLTGEPAQATGAPVPDTAVAIPEYPLYVLKWLGAALAPWDGGRAPWLNAHGTCAVLSGLVGLILMGLAMRRHATGRVEPWAAACFGLAAYCLFTACAAAWFRVQDSAGSGQALSSRYITVSNLFWIALILLWTAPESACAAPCRRQTAFPAAVSLFLLAVASLHGLYTWSLRYPAYEQARAALVHGEDNPLLDVLYPDPAKLKERSEFLREHGLGPFRNP